MRGAPRLHVGIYGHHGRNRRPAMPKLSRTSRRRTRAARKPGNHRQALTREGEPLLQLHVHWTTPAHPRFLEAAGFLWR